MSLPSSLYILIWLYFPSCAYVSWCVCVCVCVRCNNIQAGIMYNQRVIIAIIFWVFSLTSSHHLFPTIPSLALGRRNKRRANNNNTRDQALTLYILLRPFFQKQKSRWNRKPTDDSFLFQIHCASVWLFKRKEKRLTDCIFSCVTIRPPNRAYQDRRFSDNWSQHAVDDNRSNRRSNRATRNE